MSAEDQDYTDGGLNPYYIGDCKYCALKAGMIDELEKCGEHRQGIIEIQETHIAELAQQLAELREVTRELANDVEAYADVDRHGRFAYPHIMAKWESDMEPVNRARALLQERSDEGT